MSKRAIWIIIGLMSAALVGMVALQIYWLKYSLNLNEVKFDQSVFSALNEVKNRLEKEDEKASLSLSNLGGNLFRMQENSQYDFLKGGQGRRSGIGGTYNFRDSSKLVDYMDLHLQLELKKMKRLVNAEGIEERIDLDFLNNALELELENRNIGSYYNYGIYSNKDSSIVISNGHYTSMAANIEAASNVNEAEEIIQSTLLQSMYRVKLFDDEYGPAGSLMIQFPARVSLIWQGSWKTLLWSILFTATILFCFSYTIFIVFRQKKLSSMKTDFINNMTHEFKTPIATISLAADSITSPMISGKVDKVARFANIIKQENKRMLSQVEKVLQMALIEKEDLRLKISPVNVHEIILQAVDNYSIVVNQREGTVTSKLEAEEPVIEADPTHISNMIHNLMDNANKYAPENPEIIISTHNIPNALAITVTDNGIGMTKEARKHIFDKFYRVHTGNLHDVKGFGLGLSYVKAMVTALNGRIEVASELGKGSSFTLIFPIRQKN